MGNVIKIVLCILLCLLPLDLNALEGYDRHLYGGWADLDGDGLDTRQESLDSHALVLVNKSRVWLCPYSGKLFKDPSKLDIDHIVPLQWSWEHGASQWGRLKRIQFANDLENLIPVSAATNRSKGAKGPDKWVPPNLSYSVEYINRFTYICEKYGLIYPKELFDKILRKLNHYKKGVRLSKEK